MLRAVVPFSPAGNGVTVNFAAGHSPLFGGVKFDNMLITGAKSRSVRVFNAGPDIAFIELTGSQGDQSASVSNSLPLASGQAIVLRTQGSTFISATTPTTAQIYATPGEGQS